MLGFIIKICVAIIAFFSCNPIGLIISAISMLLAIWDVVRLLLMVIGVYN